MTVSEILSQLKALGSEKVRQMNTRNGAGSNQFGVKMGDIRNVAKPLKKNNELAKELWATGNVDARFVAILIINPKKITADEIEAMVLSEKFVYVIDWLVSNVIKEFADKEALRIKFMQSDNPVAARVGWSLTAGRIARSPEGIDIPALLQRIEKEMPTAAPAAQWTMNIALAYIGIHHPEYRQQALNLGEVMGIYRDYPTSKGCTSPFAPIWINEMVNRQG